jgi:hypothetical protein
MHLRKHNLLQADDEWLKRLPAGRSDRVHAVTQNDKYRTDPVGLYL